MDCVFTRIINYNDKIIDFVSKYATIMDYTDKILEKNFRYIRILSMELRCGHGKNEKLGYNFISLNKHYY